MRRFYRVIPQLDRYSDEFCRTLVRRLGMRRAARTATVLFFNVAVATMGGFAGAVVLGPVVYMIVVSSAGDRSGAGVWFLGTSFMFGIAGFTLTYWYLDRSARLNLLREAVRPRFIDGGRCIVCGYALDGLVGENQRVVCPECGRRVPIGVGAVSLVDEMIARGELPEDGTRPAAAPAGVAG